MRSGDFKETYADLVVLSDSKPVWGWGLVLLVALVVLPFVVNAYILSLLTLVFITATGALGLNLLTGMTGLISLGHAGFLLLGAYGYAIAVAKYHYPPLVGFLAAGVAPALFSVVVGIPSLRLRGLYLAITTLAFSYIIANLILEARSFTGGARGISVLRPEFLFFKSVKRKRKIKLKQRLKFPVIPRKLPIFFSMLQQQNLKAIMQAL